MSNVDIRKSVLENLQKTIDKYDYMSLVAIQLRIETGFYESKEVNGVEKAKEDIRFLENYKKSYPYIVDIIDETIKYLKLYSNAIEVTNKIEGVR